MVGIIAKRATGKWRAGYRDGAGKEHSRQVDRKIDAQQWLAQVTSAPWSSARCSPATAFWLCPKTTDRRCPSNGKHREAP